MSTMPSWASLGLNLPYVEGSMDGETPRWTDIAAMARAAEAVGFDAVWVSDHVGFGDPDTGWSGAWESWTLLSALAVATERVRLGTYVTAVPYRNPALLAKMAETLDEVSGGRLVLGLGAGWNRPEFDAYGFPWERRFDRFEDGLRIITSMLRTGRADHLGRIEAVRGALAAPRGPRPGGLPVMVGAAAPRMLRLAAELADEWNAGMRTPAGLAPMVAALDARMRDRRQGSADDPPLGRGDGGARCRGRTGRRPQRPRFLGRPAPGFAGGDRRGPATVPRPGDRPRPGPAPPEQDRELLGFGAVLDALRGAD